MSGDPNVTAEDEGKTVVTRDGDEIGRISDVQNNAVVVESPESGLSDSIRSRVNWEHTRGDKYLLQASQVDDVTDDTVVVGDLSED